MTAGTELSPAAKAGTITLGGDLTVNRMGYGAMRITGQGIWGPPNDVDAALAWLKREFDLPIIFAGFSFGAATGLRAACPHPDVKALISIGTPVEADGRLYSYSFLRDCAKPKLFVSGDHDQYGPHAALEAVVAQAAPPKKLVFVPGDHFFQGHLNELRAAVETWLRQLLAGRTVC